VAGAGRQHLSARRAVEIAAEFLGEQETPNSGSLETSVFGNGCQVTSKLPDARFMVFMPAI
jgi:hypothetical protein